MNALCAASAHLHQSCFVLATVYHCKSYMVLTILLNMWCSLTVQVCVRVCLRVSVGKLRECVLVFLSLPVTEMVMSPWNGPSLVRIKNIDSHLSEDIWQAICYSCHGLPRQGIMKALLMLIYTTILTFRGISQTIIIYNCYNQALLCLLSFWIGWHQETLNCITMFNCWLVIFRSALYSQGLDDDLVEWFIISR